MNESEIIKAHEMSEDGPVRELHEYLKPFLDIDDPYAIYLSSTYSLKEWNETVEEMDERSVDCLLKASEAGVAPAMYRLSSAYFTGEVLDVDLRLYKYYLDKAFELGFGPAKLTVGVNHYYGLNGYPEENDKGQKLVREAASEKVEHAAYYLEKIQSDSWFGYWTIITVDALEESAAI